MRKRAKRASQDALFRHMLDRWASRALRAVLLGSLLVFVLYPLACLLARSFGGAGGWTAEAYRAVWQQYRTDLWNSIFVAVLAAVFSTALSVCTALCLCGARGWHRALLMGVLFMAMVSPPFVSSMAYIQLFGRRGLITHRLLGLTWNPYNAWGVIATQAVSFVPTNALFLLGMLEKLDADSFRAARDLGARPAHLLRDMALPLLRPGILVSLLLSFIRSLADFGTPIMIGGRFSTLAADIYLQITGYSNLEKAAAMNMLLLVPALGAFFFYRRQMAAAPASVGRGQRCLPTLCLWRSGPLGWLSLAGGGLFFTVMALQYLCIFLTGFLKQTRGQYTFTTQYLQQLLQRNGTMLVRSVGYALAVALVGTLFAVLFACYTARRPGRGSRFFDALASFPYLIPGTCWGIGYILAFNHAPLKLTGTAAIVLLNMLFKQLPTTTKICAAGLTQIPDSLERAARDLGGGRLAVLRDVVLPNMKTTFFSCFSYHFSASITSAGAILFLIDPGRKLAVFQLFDAVYTGDYATAALIASMMILVVAAVEGLVFWLTRREGKGRVSGIGAHKKEL